MKLDSLTALTQLKTAQQCPTALIFEGDLADSCCRQLLERWLCEQNRACGHCQGCQLYQAQTHPDLHWISTESGHAIKIDPLREVLDLGQQTPMFLPWQIVVIEESDALNVYAANALLKSLEEPSAGLLFIFLTRQADLLPKTLLSRCWRIVCQSLFAESLENSEYFQDLQSLQMLVEDLFSCILESSDLLSFVKKYESMDLDTLLCRLQWIVQDFMCQYWGGVGYLKFKMSFQVMLPLQYWWRFWDRLMIYRAQWRHNRSLHVGLLLSNLLLLLQGEMDVKIKID